MLKYCFGKEIDEIKQIQKTQGDILQLEESHHHEIADRMTTLENFNFDVEAEKHELKM
jgi:NifU-like protein involved in Fe-S cluster formation